MLLNFTGQWHIQGGQLSCKWLRFVSHVFEINKDTIEVLQATASERLAQSPYVVARMGSYLRPSDRKAPNLPLSHQAPQLELLVQYQVFILIVFNKRNCIIVNRRHPVNFVCIFCCCFDYQIDQQDLLSCRKLILRCLNRRLDSPCTDRHPALSEWAPTKRRVDLDNDNIYDGIRCLYGEEAADVASAIVRMTCGSEAARTMTGSEQPRKVTFTS